MQGRHGIDPLAQQSSRRTPSTLSSTSSSRGLQGAASQPSPPPAPPVGSRREPTRGDAILRQLPHFHGRTWLSKASSSSGYAYLNPRPATRVHQVSDQQGMAGLPPPRMVSFPALEVGPAWVGRLASSQYGVNPRTGPVAQEVKGVYPAPQLANTPASVPAEVSMAHAAVGVGVALGNTYLLERGGTDKTTEGVAAPRCLLDMGVISMLDFAGFQYRAGGAVSM